MFFFAIAFRPAQGQLHVYYFCAKINSISVIRRRSENFSPLASRQHNTTPIVNALIFTLFIRVRATNTIVTTVTYVLYSSLLSIIYVHGLKLNAENTKL